MRSDHHAAIECGMTLSFDTAWDYHDGGSGGYHGKEPCAEDVKGARRSSS